MVNAGEGTSLSLIFSCFAMSSTVSLLFWGISSLAFPSFCGCGWMARALCIRHTRTAIFKHINPLIHNSTRESIVPILSTHALMNLSTWYTFCPQKSITDRCSSQVSLLRSNSHTNCEANRLALPTPALSIFFERIKVRKLFEDPSYVWVLSLFVLPCVGSGVATGWSPSKGSYRHN
jgi:hypothetical protein